MSTLLRLVLLLAALAAVVPGRAAWALSADDVRLVVEGTPGERVEAVQRLAASGDPAAVRLIRALAAGALYADERGVYLVEQGVARDAFGAAEVALPAAAQAVVVNRRLRSVLQMELAALDLVEGAAAQRQAAAAAQLREAAFRAPDDAALAALLRRVEAAAAARPMADEVRDRLRQAAAVTALGAGEPAERLRAVAALAGASDPALRPLLQQRLEHEPEPAVRAALQTRLAEVERSLALAAAAGQVFAGVSLGSILLLAALGLAITYGLLGVINMAHGELIMVGAYTTFVVQELFRHHWPQAFDAYLLAAIPVAFVTAAAVGAAIERGVVRHLYGRPLETLLATWGVSLILIQAARGVFGAQNVTVENPAWLAGGLELGAGLVLPWSRIAVLLFALGVLLAVALLIARTRLGLFVRGVTQNRPIAACMGVNTARVDTLAFALGSGVAGLAGVALSQIGNVGPDLGQAYIVDSFLVVVVGGVGQLAGAVVAAFGLGLLNKFLEGWAGAVLAKIAVLLLIVAFIQKRPQGLFALRGRAA